MYKRHLKQVLALAGLFVFLSSHAQENLSIAGNWEFETDNQDVGLTEGWQSKGKFSDVILLPGSMPERLKGDMVDVNTKWVGSLYDSSYYFNPAMAPYRQKGNIKFPFFLTPEHHYVGTAWYRKDVTIPKTWKGKQITLYLERPHIETTLWVNGQRVGSQNSLSVPHVYDITSSVKTGKNSIVLRIDNRSEITGVGIDSHSITDQTQGDWNGIVGKMELQARPQTHIQDLQVHASASNDTVFAKIGTNGKAKKVTVEITAIDQPELLHYSKTFRLTSARQTLPLLLFGEKTSEALRSKCLWSADHPQLMRLTATLDNSHRVETTFGIRDISIKGKSILVNGHTEMMRGTVENCCFPLTGYPPTDTATWMNVFRKCKEYGINHIRFHTYCPPEAAFEAADRIGLYLQPEGPSWPNHGVSLGRGEIIDTYLWDECERIVREYGNHPSFAMLAAGNEPRGRWVEWASRFVKHWKEKDTRRIYTGFSVGGGWQWQPDNQYHVKAGARGLTWDKRAPQTMDDYSKEISSFFDKATKKTFDIHEPFITHEMGQWCAFPDFKEISQYTGVYKARNFEIFRDILKKNHMADRAEKFLASSGKLQLLCYKYEIERLRRTDQYAGYQLLALNDYSGQGTALEGVLNVFWREKGYCTAEDFRTFNNDIVLLARFPKFVYKNNENAEVSLLISNFSPMTSLVGSELIVHFDQVSSKDIRFTLHEGNLLKIGENLYKTVANLALPLTDVPQKITMELTLKRQDGSVATSNQYDYWSYPAEVQAADGDVYVTDTLDAKALKTLDNGGKVLLAAAGKIRFGKDVKQQYLPVFWNTSWFKMRPPHTTGAYIENTHPVFKDFPTDNWTNLHWWELVNHAQVMQFDEFPDDFQPLVQSIDTWFVSRKIGMLFEACVGKGKLMMTTCDISHNLDKRIVARQLRSSILNYMNTNDFQPEYKVDIEVIRHLFEKNAPVLDMYTKDSPDELKPKFN